MSRTLRAQVQRRGAIQRIGEICITDIVVDDGVACGAVGFSVSDGRAVSIAARAVIVTTGGLTRLYARNSASANMGGDGYALALRAGAELIDMEFVQFFPIGHLAPRLIGMDPIMWDPFRYKLGGKLLNADGRDFIDDYGVVEDGHYRAPRDVATYAIVKEIEAGRGTPSGGVYLSFQHIGSDKLREAFGPVIDRLAANGIDLTREPVEVAPIAHYHMGGIRVGADFETRVLGLFAAGEAVGGANGANRLSGNAITEALVFGRRAGLSAADRTRGSGAAPWNETSTRSSLVFAKGKNVDTNSARVIARLQSVMSEGAGLLRTEKRLTSVLDEIIGLGNELGAAPPALTGNFDMARLDWFDARNMVLVAEAVVRAGLARRESRGAHQREDFANLDPQWTKHQTITLRDNKLLMESTPAASETAEAAQ